MFVLPLLDNYISPAVTYSKALMLTDRKKKTIESSSAMSNDAFPSRNLELYPHNINFPLLNKLPVCRTF